MSDRFASPGLRARPTAACCGVDRRAMKRPRSVSRPCPGVRRQVGRGHNESKPAGQGLLAIRPSQARLPGQEKSGFSRLQSFSEAALPVPIPSTRRASPQPAPTAVVTPFAPPASGSWLSTTRRTIGAACRDGGGSAGSRHAAQVRHRPSGARQPARARRTMTRPPCWANVQRRPS
jgi:hypothetical protein